MNLLGWLALVEDGRVSAKQCQGNWGLVEPGHLPPPGTTPSGLELQSCPTGHVKVFQGTPPWKKATETFCVGGLGNLFLVGLTYALSLRWAASAAALLSGKSRPVVLPNGRVGHIFDGLPLASLKPWSDRESMFLLFQASRDVRF